MKKNNNYMRTILVALTALLATTTTFTAQGQGATIRTLKPGAYFTVTLKPDETYTIQKSGSYVNLSSKDGSVDSNYDGTTHFVPKEETVTVTGIRINSPAANPIYTYPGREIDFSASATPASASELITWSSTRGALNDASGATTKYTYDSYLWLRSGDITVTAKAGTFQDTRTVRVSARAEITNDPDKLYGTEPYNIGGARNWVATHVRINYLKVFYAANETQWNNATGAWGGADDWSLVPYTTSLYTVTSSNPNIIAVDTSGGLWRLTALKSSGGSVVVITVKSAATGSTLWTYPFGVAM